MTTTTLRWIESGGGPLLLLPATLLDDWRGGISVGAAGATDYDRACAVREYLGMIRVGAGLGVVLGDEPMSTAWFPLAAGGLLVRWGAAESEAAVLEELNAGAFDFGEPSLSLDVDSDLILFDSAYGSKERRPEDLRIRLPGARYRLQTAEVRRELLWLVIHRLTPG